MFMYFHWIFIDFIEMLLISIDFIEILLIFIEFH